MKTYKRAVPPGPWWTELAILAISMGSAGIGGLVAGHLAPKLGPWIARMGAKQLGAAASHAAVVSGLTESIQTGIASALRPAESAAAGALQPRREKERKDSEISTNAEINFFAVQRNAVIKKGESYARVIARQEKKLQPLLRTSPEVALGVMKEMLYSLTPVDEAEAVKQQALSTSQQWMVGIARGVAGEEVVADGGSGKERATTNFKNGFGAPDGQPFARGLLRVAITLTQFADARKAPFTVDNAALDGLPQEVADRLSKYALETAEIPTRIVVTSSLGKAWITRDEAGRILITGRLPVIGDASTPENMHAGAKSICDRLFAKSLVDWGIKNVQTDDESKRT